MPARNMSPLNIFLCRTAAVGAAALTQLLLSQCTEAWAHCRNTKFVFFSRHCDSRPIQDYDSMMGDQMVLTHSHPAEACYLNILSKRCIFNWLIWYTIRHLFQGSETNLDLADFSNNQINANVLCPLTFKQHIALCFIKFWYSANQENIWRQTLKRLSGTSYDTPLHQWKEKVWHRFTSEKV